jgi:hypothetical protein
MDDRHRHGSLLSVDPVSWTVTVSAKEASFYHRLISPPLVCVTGTPPALRLLTHNLMILLCLRLPAAFQQSRSVPNFKDNREASLISQFLGKGDSPPPWPARRLPEYANTRTEYTQAGHSIGAETKGPTEILMFLIARRRPEPHQVIVQVSGPARDIVDEAVESERPLPDFMDVNAAGVPVISGARIPVTVSRSPFLIFNDWSCVIETQNVLEQDFA